MDLTVVLSDTELIIVAAFYIFFMILRLWKNIPLYEIIAMIPVLVLLLHFKDTYILAFGFAALFLVHITHVWVVFKKED